MATTPAELPVFMRIGNGQEIRVGTIEMRPGDDPAEAVARITQVLTRVAQEVEHHI